MDNSVAHPSWRGAAFSLPAWKSGVGTVCALVLCFLFVLAGTWKITDVFGAATRMIQMQVPGDLAVASALALGISEIFAGVLLLIPRFRRWGAWLTAGLLLVFMAYIGANYAALRGQDCTCFPSLNLFGLQLDFERAVGPEFFIGDAAMLAIAVVAGWWAKPSTGWRMAALLLAGIALFGFTSVGIAHARQTGVQAPASITVDGKPYPLAAGKHFLYFFDPECSHCFEAAQRLAKHSWQNTGLVAVPTVQARFAQSFLTDTGFKAGVSNDLQLLRKTFPFSAGPYAVAIEDGRQKASFLHFDDKQPEAPLRQFGFIR